ncbi:MAG: NAD-dependent epimerase/dehydratase family protein [Acidobacteriota bacterium]
MSGFPERPGHFLITGGAGFIGSHLAETCLAAGHRVTVIDDLSTGSIENVAHLLASPAFRLVTDTIANPAALESLVAECDAVVHLAAAVGVDLIVRDPVRVIECNVIGTHAVLRAAARHRRKVLLASSSEVYGKGVQAPFREDDDRLLGPTSKARWCYSTSKAAGEYLALAYHRQQGLPVVVMRFFNTIGPRQSGRYGMVVPRFITQALSDEPLTVYGDGRQSRCFCDVLDVVRAILALASCPAAVGQVFNVGATEEVTILELARRVLALVGGAPAATAGELLERGRIRLIPFEAAYESGFEDMLRRVPDIGRLSRLTGWAPEIPLDATLRRVIDTLSAQHSRRAGAESPH